MKFRLLSALCIVLVAHGIAPAPRLNAQSPGWGCADEAGGGDCNANGVEDAVDIASGYSADLDGNGVPDECERRAASN